MIKNLRKLSKRTVDQVELRLSRFITASQFRAILKADDEAMRRLAATWPDTEPVVVAQPAQAFEEPESHIRARQILGKDFQGIVAVEKHLGAFTEAEREERKLLRLRDHHTGEFLSQEATLVLLDECKGHYVLCAMHSQNLIGIHQEQKPLFTADPNEPWFGERSQVKTFAGIVNADPWVLMRKTIVPKSNRKGTSAQKKHLAQGFPKERCILPAEFGAIAIVYFLETGEKLGGNYVIRFFVQSAAGVWVSVGWDGDRLNFSSSSSNASSNIGSLSARTS